MFDFDKFIAEYSAIENAEPFNADKLYNKSKEFDEGNSFHLGTILTISKKDPTYAPSKMINDIKDCINMSTEEGEFLLSHYGMAFEALKNIASNNKGNSNACDIGKLAALTFSGIAKDALVDMREMESGKVSLEDISVTCCHICQGYEKMPITRGLCKNALKNIADCGNLSSENIGIQSSVGNVLKEYDGKDKEISNLAYSALKCDYISNNAATSEVTERLSILEKISHCGDKTLQLKILNDVNAFFKGSENLEVRKKCLEVAQSLENQGLGNAVRLADVYRRSIMNRELSGRGEVNKQPQPVVVNNGNSRGPIPNNRRDGGR